MTYPSVTRRRLLAGMAAAASIGPSSVFGQQVPSRNMRVVIPTAQGGGADRLARTFDDFWGPQLKTKFEYNFHPGAAGQVGYELYLHKREHDGHNLLFGNMGPEMIMYALQKPAYKFPGDYQYFCRLDVDDSVVFVSQKSPFKRIEDVVAEAKKKTVNVAVSRLPHPASIGLLALGNAQKARFNLVPYGGGNPTQVAVLNGEAHCGALPIAEFGSPAQQDRWLKPLVDEGVLLSAAFVELGGTDVTSPRCSARREAGGWRLSGAKECVPVADQAAAVLVPARAPEGVSHPCEGRMRSPRRS